MPKAPHIRRARHYRRGAASFAATSLILGCLLFITGGIGLWPDTTTAAITVIGALLAAVSIVMGKLARRA
jgi:hypothetical protein